MIKPTLANNILKLFFAQSTKLSDTILPDKCYIGIATAGDLNANGTNFVDLEPSTDAGYKRYLLCSYGEMEVTNKMTTPTSGSIQNVETIFFPKATSAWGEIKYFGLISDVSGGEPVFWGEIKAPKLNADGEQEFDENGHPIYEAVSVEKSEVAIFSPGQLKITLS